MEMRVTGYKKFHKIKKIISKENLSQAKFEILDVGGVPDTFQIIQQIFPRSKVYTLNSVEEDLQRCENKIIGDAENLSVSLKSRKFDIIFATDVIEHLMFPDKMLEGCYKHLKKNGLLFITTPNLACWYNRIFLFFGLSPANYHPSTEYRVGNRLIGKFPGSHKSVFTLGGLKELVKIYKFEILYVEGFEYKELTVAAGRYGVFRETVNRFIPKGLKEGILLVARKNDET